jgi:hypothetical protein
MTQHKKTKSVHNKWHTITAFPTKKHFTHFLQQINAVYRDKCVDMSPIQFWKVQVSETSLTHPNLNDKHYSRQLQIAANQYHQNTVDKISMFWNTHHPDHNLFHTISSSQQARMTVPKRS